MLQSYPFIGLLNSRKTALACLMSLSLLPGLSLAAPKQYGNVVVDEVTSIYDADTFTVNIKSWPTIIGDRIKVRVRDIDSAEISGKCRAEIVKARLAKEYTVESLRAAKQVELKNLGRDKYFRLLADVSIDGKDLGSQLIARGFARPYDGGKKSSWCEGAQ